MSITPNLGRVSGLAADNGLDLVMVDLMSAEKRSALMSRIQGKNTAPELFVRQYLWRAGFRFKLHQSGLPGRPDLVLKRWNAVLFINGCFWHRHEGCPYFRLPKTRRDFWDEKLRANRRAVNS
jgi:DNA mismatch endonuclease, patch repair protein